MIPAFLLLTLATLVSMIAAIADSQSVQAGDLLPGDPAPEFKIHKWLQKGAYDAVQPINGRRITVIEFWTDWCPLCRTVLPIHDRLQAELGQKGVRFLSIAEGELDVIQATVKQLDLHNIAVAYDDGGAVFDAYMSTDSSPPIPFTVVIEEYNEPGSGRVLWKGPAVTYKGANSWDMGYTTRLDDVLAEVTAGRHDVAAAREIERARAAAARLCHQVRQACWTGQIDQIRALAREVMDGEWPAVCNEMLAETLALAAWSLVSATKPGREQLSDGLEIVRAATRMHSEDSASMLHVYARALFESGDVEQAVAAEQRALELPLTGTCDSLSRQDCETALARYKEALPGNQDKKAADEESAPEEAAAPEPQKEKTPPADDITSEQAVSDLLGLHDYLRLNYAAYDDIAWQLAAEGSSWEKHNAAFLDRIRTRKRWPVCDLFDLVSEYLKVAPDRHLSIMGTFSRGDTNRTERFSPATGVSPFFANVRVREDDGRMTLAQVPKDLSVPAGAVLTDVPVIGSPNTARAGCVYLFPTLPLESIDIKEYLLGVLEEPSSSPGPVRVSVTDPSADDGTGPQEIELAVHRGREAYTRYGKADPWSLSLEPVPVLTVRRLWGDGLDGMPETAAKLRDLPMVVLDIRENRGGNDAWAMKWATQFSDQPYQAYAGWAELRRGETDPLRRWDCHADLAASDSDGGDTSASKGPYQGRLFVVTGIVCGSSGETFANLASQMPGAILVGENTAGCGRYGNFDQSFNLPHAGIVVQFGRTKFAVGLRPTRECFGMFPDYWLDDKDPISAIMAYCSMK